MTAVAARRRTPRIIGLAGACALVVVTLTGCLKLDADLTVNADATATGTLAIEFQKEAASFLGISDLASFEENFNGEELGLWGSKEYVRAHERDTIAAMVNMDMTGAPQGFSAGGFDELVPLLSGVARKLGGFAMQEEAANSPGTNSDHEPFMLKGIPALSVFGHLDGDKVRYYHDFGDTFDKADRKGMAEASGVVAVLIRELANATSVTYARKSREDVIAMLKKGKIDERLKRQGEWPFEQ